MDFEWTMISYGTIYPCRRVIVSTLILAHFLLLPHYYKLMQLYLQTNTFYILQSHTYKLILFLQSHLGMLFAMKKNVIILTNNIGGYNMDNNNNNNKSPPTSSGGKGVVGAVSYVLGCPLL